VGCFLVNFRVCFSYSYYLVLFKLFSSLKLRKSYAKATQKYQMMDDQNKAGGLITTSMIKSRQFTTMIALSTVPLISYVITE
jgi:hypothetical protein